MKNSFPAWEKKGSTWFSFYFEFHKVLLNETLFLRWNIIVCIYLTLKERGNEENVLFHWTVGKKNEKKAKTFNILILKWSRKITTGHNRMKSDIYRWWFGIVSWVFNFPYHSRESWEKILRQNCQHLVTSWLRFLCLSFISCHISLSFLTRFLWDKLRNCLKCHWVQKIGRVFALLIVAVSC